MTLEQALELLEEVRERIDDDELEPDPTRSDWDRSREALRALRTDAETLGRGLGQSTSWELEDRNQGDQIAAEVAGALAEVAAVHAAAGDHDAARSLLRTALDLAPSADPRRDQWLEASQDLDHFTYLTRGFWLQRHRSAGPARAAFRQVISQSRSPELRAAAARGLEGPWPIDKAPSLWRINGCGIGLYGGRNHHPDGTCVKTTCISLLFAPLIPLRAYRVLDQGGSWIFLARERLSRFARLARLVVVVSAVMAIAGFSIKAYLDSPTRRAKLALAEARGLEERGEVIQAQVRYDQIIAEYGGRVASDVLTPAATGLVRIAAGRVAEPFTLDGVDAAYRMVSRFDSLPPTLRPGPPQELVVAKLVGWADALGDQDPVHADGSVRLLDWAAELDSTVWPRRNRARIALAQRMAADRPIRALRLLDALGADPEALRIAAGVLASFDDESSLWLEAEPEVRRWLERNAHGDAPVPGGTAGVRGRLDVVVQRAADADRQDLLESRDRAALTAAHRDHPADQELAVALAETRALAGDLAGALAPLNELGPPGRLTAMAQVTLATLNAESGDLARADQILTDLIAERLPSYQEALARFDEGMNAVQDALIKRAEQGNIPIALQHELESAPEAEQAEIFFAWVGEQIGKDDRITELGDAVRRDAVVVVASVSLGTIKLQRADAATGDAKQELLRSAEQVFLAIRQGAEGQPEFHIGLGQVYYRLGKNSEGEAELTALLERDEPELTLWVARTYRDLGLESRTTELAEKVYATANAPWKEQAALLRSLVADDYDDRETWLGRCDQKLSFVHRGLLEVKAHRAYRAGNFGQADKLFGQVADAWNQDAAKSSAAANNAALAMQQRFGCTGDPKHLDRAVRSLEQARQVEPDSSLILGNLASVSLYLGEVRVLAKWFDLRTLLPSDGDAGALIEMLADGPDRAAIAAALRADPAVRRARQLMRQEQVLAPQRAGSYDSELSLDRVLDDDDDEQQMLDRVRRVMMEPDPSLAEWLSGARDDEYRTAVQEKLAHAERILERARRRGDAKTLAAALLLDAFAVRRQMVVDEPLPIAETYLALLDQAQAAHGLEGIRRLAAWARVSLSSWRALEKIPGLAERWRRDRRELSEVVMLHQALTDHAEPLRAALAAQPELARVKSIINGQLADRAELRHWVLARAQGDAEMEARAAAGLTASAQRESELTALLHPDSKDSTLRLELMRQLAAR